MSPIDISVVALEVAASLALSSQIVLEDSEKLVSTAASLNQVRVCFLPFLCSYY
jgi:hypothetical protein